MLEKTSAFSLSSPEPVSLEDPKTRNLQVIEEVGRGVYGSVSRAEHMQSRQVVAVKNLGRKGGTWGGIRWRLFSALAVGMVLLIKMTRWEFLVQNPTHSRNSGTRILAILTLIHSFLCYNPTGNYPVLRPHFFPKLTVLIGTVNISWIRVVEDCCPIVSSRSEHHSPYNRGHVSAGLVSDQRIIQCDSLHGKLYYGEYYCNPQDGQRGRILLSAVLVVHWMVTVRVTSGFSYPF